MSRHQGKAARYTLSERLPRRDFSTSGKRSKTCSGKKERKQECVFRFSCDAQGCERPEESSLQVPGQNDPNRNSCTAVPRAHATNESLLPGSSPPLSALIGPSSLTSPSILSSRSLLPPTFLVLGAPQKASSVAEEQS